MRTIVSKFGGSSTAGAASLRQVLAIVRAGPARRCVVLSAPGADAENPEKVTSLLEECWRARDDRAAFGAAALRIARRFSDIARSLGLEDMRREAARELVRAAGVSRDCLLSRGEYLCARLFARFSGLPMVDAAALIAFDGHGEADEAETAARFREASARYGRFVVPGFYGAGPDGAIRVFPRNGSDITGALAAAGMGAGLYENWTDVPGLMTADPAVVPGARLIRQVGYRQMRALARAGARVLHPSCLDPVALAGIPTRLRCTWAPESYGTLIDDAFDAFVPCVAGRDGEISAFGLPPERVMSAAMPLNPDFVRAEGERVIVRVGPERFGDAVRHLHRALIEA